MSDIDWLSLWSGDDDNKLSDIDWLSLWSGDVDNKVSFFVKCFNELYWSSFLLINKNVSVKRMMKPLLSPSILSLIKIKYLYFKFYKQGLITRELNNCAKNKIQSIINKSKRSYYHHSLMVVRWSAPITGAGDSAKTWRLMNNAILSKNKNKSTKSLSINGSELGNR